MAGLWRDRGGRRGASDPAHARLTDGARQCWGPGGQRLGAGGSERKRGSGGIGAVTGGASQHSAAARFSPV
jgi:hypothetical protein